MRRAIPISTFTILSFIALSCSIRKYQERYDRLYKRYNSVEVTTLLKDSLLNVRALEIDENGYFGFATSNGEIGGKDLDWRGGKSYSLSEERQLEVEGDLIESASISIQLKHDSIIPNFRSLAVTKDAGFVMSIGSPALLYRINNDSISIVYKEMHPKVFYDSMEFWNDLEGIAIGDPTDGCMSIIITRDGGANWNKLSCNSLPTANEGEAAFAASDTNIAIVGDAVWIATGGKSSRILYSPDKGISWEIMETPIIQGKETTGIYSIDFYNAERGFAIGGDYLNPDENSANKMRTLDGGKTWAIVGAGQSPGYRSCVQFIPNNNGRELVAVGFKGIDYSPDFGASWTHMSDESFYTIRFLNDSTAYAAGKGRISKLTFK